MSGSHATHQTVTKLKTKDKKKRPLHHSRRERERERDTHLLGNNVHDGDVQGAARLLRDHGITGPPGEHLPYWDQIPYTRFLFDLW